MMARRYSTKNLKDAYKQQDDGQVEYADAYKSEKVDTEKKSNHSTYETELKNAKTPNDFVNSKYRAMAN